MSLELSPDAQARLNDKKWRRSQSKWMLWIYLSSSTLGVIGFARLAIKTKDKTLKNYAYIFSGLLFLIFLIAGLSDSTTTQVDGQDVTESDPLGSIGGFLIVINYGLQIFLSLKANKIWLVFKAQNNEMSWTAENLNVANPIKNVPAAPEGMTTDVLGIDSEEYFAPTVAQQTSKVMPPPPTTRKMPPPPPPVVKAQTQEKNSSTDLNTASVEILMKEAGFDPVLAANTVVQREKRGGFSCFEEFANDLSLQPHQVAKLKPILIVEKQGEASGGSGRILDI